jgi:uncharacterized protein
MMKPDFDVLYQAVTNKLSNELQHYYTYHDVEHTKYVVSKVLEIGTAEGLSEEELYLTQVAALYHDTGFLIDKTEHEALGCQIIAEELSSQGFSQQEIEMMQGMIMATRIPQKPQTLLEQVLADADLEYLGGDQYDEISTLLYKELLHFNPGLSEKDWLRIQIQFMESHDFHTSYCMRMKSYMKSRILHQLNLKLQALNQ